MYYRVFPAAVGVLAGLAYLAWVLFLGVAPVAESKLIMRPIPRLQGMYAGQLDRYISNEIDVLLSTDSVDKVAKSTGGVTSEQISAATTAAQSPGSDVVIIRVGGLGEDLNRRVNEALLKKYSSDVTSRAEVSGAQPSKDIADRLDALRKQITVLSAKISEAVNRAQGRAPLATIDPSVVAPTETSERSLLIAQYSQLQQEAALIASQQLNASTGVEVIQRPAISFVRRPFSMLSIGAAFMGGAFLGLALALVMVRIRPTVQSWEEVERVMNGRSWLALDSRVPAGVQMPNPALTSLAVWLGDEGRRHSTIQLEIADLPGLDHVSALARRAAEKAAETQTDVQYHLRTVRQGIGAGHATGILVPYRSGQLRKQSLQDFVEHVDRDTTVLVIAA